MHLGAHLVAFFVRLVVSALVLWLGVAWVSPKNPQNTFGRAVVISLFLSIAYLLTGAPWLWLLVVPWLIYVAIWLGTIMGSYRLSFPRALLLALVLVFLSWLTERLTGVQPRWG